MADTYSLVGRRVLLVEDEYFIADDMAGICRQKGIDVVGPAPTIGEALDLIARTDRLDGAVLDVNLRGDMVFPVADALEARHIPFVFVTGYDEAVIPPRYRNVACCEKPIEFARIAEALFLGVPCDP